jgi:hypothetical protein
VIKFVNFRFALFTPPPLGDFQVVNIIIWMNLNPCSLRPSCPATVDHVGITGVHRYLARPCGWRVNTSLWIGMTSPTIAGEFATVVATNHRASDSVPLSGCHASLLNSLATVQACYKLSAPAALLGKYASSALTSASNCSPEPPNFSFPPNQPNHHRVNASPWLAYLRSAHTLCSFVSVYLCVPDAPRPRQLR